MSLNTYPYNPFPASTDKLDETHNAELQLEVDQLKEDVEKLETDKTDTAVMAPAFDTETGVYAVGDLVMYQGKLYEFTSAHETAGDWDPTEVTEKTVADEIGDVKSGLTNLIKIITSNQISQSIVAGSSGIIIFTMQEQPPTGYIRIARAFRRLDDGGYNLAVTTQIGGDYITYQSFGSAPDLSGYVIDVWLKA